MLELFTHDPLTGAWDNRITRGQSRQARAGEPAGSWKLEKKKPLRRRVWVDHKLYYMSRLIWKYVYGVDPQAQVDHFDRDTTNEKLDNLRDITHGHQALNKARQRNNTTGAKGIGFRQGTRRRRASWAASYCGVRPNIGFPELEHLAHPGSRPAQQPQCPHHRLVPVTAEPYPLRPAQYAAQLGTRERLSLAFCDPAVWLDAPRRVVWAYAFD